MLVQNGFTADLSASYEINSADLSPLSMGLFYPMEGKFVNTICKAFTRHICLRIPRIALIFAGPACIIFFVENHV